jgi:hypothetical protein
MGLCDLCLTLFSLFVILNSLTFFKHRPIVCMYFFIALINVALLSLCVEFCFRIIKALLLLGFVYQSLTNGDTFSIIHLRQFPTIGLIRMAIFFLELLHECLCFCQARFSFRLIFKCSAFFKPRCQFSFYLFVALSDFALLVALFKSFFSILFTDFSVSVVFTENEIYIIDLFCLFKAIRIRLATLFLQLL